MMEQWIETFTGKKYFFGNPTDDQIDIEDIAVALSNKCRFSGHTDFFSVAEHSLSVAARLPPNLRLAGLLHDAAEAYLGDIPSPLKAVLPDYRSLEKINEAAINKKFNIVDADWSLVKEADTKALFTEAHFLIPSGGKSWSLFYGKNFVVEYDYRPLCLAPPQAYKIFMKTYRQLTGEDKLQLIMP